MKIEENGSIQRRPGTLASRTEVGMIRDPQKETRTTELVLTGTPQDKSLDDGMDKVTCTVCHQMFKKRGIKIHHAKSACGNIIRTSQPSRTRSKSLLNWTPEPNHSGKVKQTVRRKTFIVSQVFHRSVKVEPALVKENSQQKIPTELNEEVVSTAWSDFLEENEEEAIRDAGQPLS